MANILITGGSGYMGTHVMRRLRDRHTVKVSEFRADDYVFDDLGWADVVIHFLQSPHCVKKSEGSILIWRLQRILILC